MAGFGCTDDPLPPPVPAPLIATDAPSPFPAGGFDDDGLAPPPVTTGAATGPSITTGVTTLDTADDGANPPIPTGIAETCFSVCDCPAGLSCLEGFCQATLDVRWCCTDPFCPSGTRCETPDGRIDLCP